MAKAVGAACNMRCRYCYYTEKADVLPTDGRGLMSEATLERYIRDYLHAQTAPTAQFVWHGGEPLLRPLSFYRRAMTLQRAYGRGYAIENVLQTNGLLLSDEWCEFLRDNHWLVGVSIDGSERQHDTYRRTIGGEPTHARVVEAIRRLQRHGVEWNAMATVNAANASEPVEFYRFFRDMGCRYLQFTPVVERFRRTADGHTRLASYGEDGTLAPYSVTPEAWGAFLCGVFDEWARGDVGRVFVQMFDATLAGYVGEEPSLCCLGTRCGHAAALEHNGDLYPCDHFVFPAYRLGNIHRHTITELMLSPRARDFAAIKTRNLPGECLGCEFLRLCHVECPRNRFALSPSGEPHMNYLCPGYRRFFAYTAPAFRHMAGVISN